MYTTLQRLERDGLARAHAPAADGSVRVRGHTARAFDGARVVGGVVDRQAPTRDELTIKVALAVTTPGVDVGLILRRQRTASLHVLQALNRARGQAADDLAWSLVLDRLSFDAQAESPEPGTQDLTTAPASATTGGDR